MTRSDLLDRIHRFQADIDSAFGDLEYPGDHAFSVNSAEEEQAEAARAYVGKHWKEVDVDVYIKHGIYWLEREAELFFLPGLLTHGLRELAGDREAFGTWPKAIAVISPPMLFTTESLWQSFRQFAESLTAQQRRLIASVIEFAAYEIDEPDEDAEYAYLQYWEEVLA